MLAVATFAAVRSSNRSARVAEMALREQRRPLLAGSRINIDPEWKIMFVDEHWVRVPLQRRSIEHIPGYDEVAPAISQHEPITVELLYSDQDGAQRTITRFTLAPIRRDDADETSRLISTARRRYLDRVGPR